MMNCARRLLPLGAAAVRAALRKIPTTTTPTALYYHHRAATATTPPQRWSLAVALLGSVLRRKPPAVVIRPSPSPKTTTHCAPPPWYHDARKKVTTVAAGALVLAAGATTCRLERVPCSNRVHVVLLSQEEAAESEFAELKSESEIVDPQHPDSVRLRRIAERILHAAYRGLGVDGGRDAVMLRRRRDAVAGWTTTMLQPHTGHLGDGRLEWELLLRNDDRVNARSLTGRIMVNTGLLDHLKTDAEIAFVLAHEIGHTLARHAEDISTWIPVVRVAFLRREELEADYIGTLLLGAAGFDPRNAPKTLYKLARIVREETVLERILSCTPSFQKRLDRLSHANVMEEALELYREAIAMEIVTNRYFSHRV